MSDGNPGSPSAREQGAALMKLGKFPQAAVTLRRAVAEHPDDEPTWRLLGGALASSGDAAGAIPAFEKAVALAPDSAQNHYNLAIAFQTVGNLYPAKTHLERALALKPDYEQALAALHDLARRGETVGYGMREATGAAPDSSATAATGAPTLRSMDDMTPVGGAASASAASPSSAFGQGGSSDRNVPLRDDDYGQAVNPSGRKGSKWRMAVFVAGIVLAALIAAILFPNLFPARR